MKNVIIGVVATAATIGFLSVIRRKAHKAREHCEELAAKCKEKMAQFGVGDAEMPEPCKEMAAKRKEKMTQFRADHETPVPTDGRRSRRSQQDAEPGLAGLCSASGRSKWSHVRQHAGREARA